MLKGLALRQVHARLVHVHLPQARARALEGAVMTAADWARSIAAGLAFAFALTAVFLILRPAQVPVYVPPVFNPASAATPHCTAATTGPAGLRGPERCAP